MSGHAPFSRYNLTPTPSLSYSRFLKHHTELNDLYWSYVPAHHFVRHSTKAIPSTSDTISALSLSGPDARRPPTKVAQWRTSLEEFSNWSRLGMILSAVSYLEVYLREVVALALASDPYVIHGMPQRLDGVLLLKAGRSIDFSEQIDGCCRGVWTSRIASFKACFGAQSAAGWEHQLSELEKIRHLRNSVGHAFGRDLRTMRDLIRGSYQPSARLSEERFKKWLSVLDATALEIDRYLTSHHIGAFEYIVFYHDQRASLRTGQLGKRSPSGALSSLIGKELGRQVTRAFSAGVVEHYEKCR